MAIHPAKKLYGHRYFLLRARPVKQKLTWTSFADSLSNEKNVTWASLSFADSSSSEKIKHGHLYVSFAEYSSGEKM
jgi:hypothetical protein